ncbi:MAG: DedA family protein [Roseiflexaceae bacterium]|nr:DedA family protein [Roseiflexaceae bacterium]
MSEWIENAVFVVMDTLGYVGIALLMLLECVFPPIPSELIVPLAGFATVRGEYSFFWVCFAATVGSVLGAVVLYYLGKLVGGQRLMGWADKYGMWLGVSSKDITRAIGWFDKRGMAVVFFCRFIPGIRSLISIPAGMAAMPMLPFLTLTTIGSALWVIVLAYFGVLLGENYAVVGQYLDPISKFVLAAMVLGSVGWVVYRFVQQRRVATQP